MTCPEIGHPIADIRTGSHQPFRAQRVERERSETNHAPLHSSMRIRAETAVWVPFTGHPNAPVNGNFKIQILKIPFLSDSHHRSRRVCFLCHFKGGLGISDKSCDREGLFCWRPWRPWTPFGRVEGRGGREGGRGSAWER